MQLDFTEAFDLHWGSHQKVWKHDRSKSLGASEVFGCLRKAFYSKHGYDKDPSNGDSWGALRRGDMIEEHHVEPVIRWYLEHKFPQNGARLLMGGKRQKTFIDAANHISATPDGLVVNADDDALAKYGVPSLGKTGAFNFEIKSIDPRVNLKEEKAIHRGQVQVQMGLTREQTRYKPNFAVILYCDASFLDDIDIFIVPFDQRTYDAAKSRANRVFRETDPAQINPEGKIDGTCEYCPYKHACAVTSKEATPTDGEANGKNASSEIMEEFGKLVSIERELSGLKKTYEAEHKEAQEHLKTWLRDTGVKRAVWGDIKASISWIKGRKSLDKEALVADGIDLSQYEKEGEGYDMLRITEKGPMKADLT